MNLFFSRCLIIGDTFNTMKDRNVKESCQVKRVVDDKEGWKLEAI